MTTRSPRTPASASSAATAPAGAPEASAPSAADSIQSVKHNARRKNIPPAGIEAQGQVQEATKVRYAYNPHLPPRLRFSDDPAQADRLPLLLQTARQRALTEDEAQELARALRRHEPWLEGPASANARGLRSSRLRCTFTTGSAPRPCARAGA